MFIIEALLALFKFCLVVLFLSFCSDITLISLLTGIGLVAIVS